MRRINARGVLAGICNRRVRRNAMDFALAAMAYNFRRSFSLVVVK